MEVHVRTSERSPHNDCEDDPASWSDQQRSVGSRVGSFILGAFSLIAILACVPLLILQLAWKDQAILGSVTIILAIFLNAFSRSISATTVLMALSIFSTLRYGYWRVIQTWQGITSANHIHRWDTVFVLLLLAAEFFAFSTLILGYFQTLRPLKRPPLPLKGDPGKWPTVDVLIPTYNEPLHVVQGTVVAAKAMDYPATKLRVLLLDDGRRHEFRRFAASIGVEYITRDDNAHAKAGNINHALKELRGQFVAIFDSDHVPERSFLQSTLGWFLKDANLGLVQTPHAFYSPDPFERNLGQFRRVPNEGELFHRLVQDGNDLWNASFFCGSCAVLRRSALDEIGGIAVETVTEDAHTALRMQRNGWCTAYINIPKAAGLATESLAAHIGQRIRWARGMTQILRLENPLFASGLTFAQRLCYFNATTHFLFAIPRLMFLTVPLTYLLFGKVNIYGYTWAIVAYAFPHLVLSSLTNSRIQGRYRHSFWNEIYEAVLAPYILFPTLLALINPKLGRFNVTSKGGILQQSYFDRRIALPYLLLLALNVAGLVMAEHRFMHDPAHRDTVIMNAVWTAYSTMILSVAASVAWEKRKLRNGACARVRIPLTLTLKGNHGLRGEQQFNGTTVLLSRTSLTLRLRRELEIARGMPVSLVLDSGEGDIEIPAFVSHSEGHHQHLFIPDLPDRKEDQFERLVYSHSKRARKSFREVQTGDRPLRSLIQIFLLALRGFLLIPIGFLLPAPDVEQEPQAAREKSIAASLIVSLLLLGYLIAPPVVRGASSAENSTGTNANGSRSGPTANFNDEFELVTAAGSRDLALRGSRATLNLFFDEPVTKITTEAKLKLRYAAPSLGPNEARLALTLNGAEAGSIPLEPGPAEYIEVSLPTDLLTNNNALSLELEGGCAACMRSHASWISLDPTSMIALSGTKLPLANDLALLPLPFFDSAGSRSWNLPVVFGDNPDGETLKSAALVASWFGVLSDVRGVHFPATVNKIPDGNVLMFALQGSPILAGLSLPSGSGPLIAMRDNPNDPYGKLLILSGDNSGQLLNAARALTTSNWLPHGEHLRPNASPLISQRGQYDAPRWLRTDQSSAIGTYTTVEHLKVEGSGSINLYFRLPPDLFLPARDSIPLTLRFSYSGTPDGSKPALSVRINGHDVDSIQLKPSVGATEQSVMFRLPTGNLLSYTNTLTVDFYFAGDTPPQHFRPSFAIHRDSSLDLSGLPHSVVLPRLELFADAGYPFTEYADANRTAVVMPPSPTSADFETLLDMAGFFGAQTGAISSGLELTTTDHLEQVENKDLVLVGKHDAQSAYASWAGSMPLRISGAEMDINPAAQLTLLLHPEWPFRNYDQRRLAQLLDDDPKFDAIIESFVSPFRSDRIVVAIDPSERTGIEAVRALFTPSERQGPVYGGLAIYQGGRFESFLVGTSAFHAGRVNPEQRVTVLLIENYRFIPVFVLLLAFIVVLWVRLSTERVAAQRLAIPQN